MPSKRIGRPLIYDTHASERIWLKVTRSQHDELQLVARDNGVNLSGLIRDAVTNYTATYLEKYPHGRRR